jgi:hypothetical protein
MSGNARRRKLKHVLASIGATLVIGGSVAVPAIALSGGSHAAATVAGVGIDENNWH